MMKRIHRIEVAREAERESKRTAEPRKGKKRKRFSKLLHSLLSGLR